MVLAENVCDGGGYRRFELIETSEGFVVEGVAGNVIKLKTMHGPTTTGMKIAGDLRVLEHATERAHDSSGAQEQDGRGAQRR